MVVNRMIDLLNARVVLEGDFLDCDIESGFCSDLMSDVLAFVNESTVLITGLTNPHVVRTSEMLDLKCIIFVRGKIPPENVIDEARDLGITVLSTDLTAFITCGILYGAGLRGVTIQRNEHGGIV
ncbi:MAG: hypothetical protein IJR97_13740 [Clostridia bacterium]|nr:hypothetical protein [Clostridia bacterium]